MRKVRFTLSLALICALVLSQSVTVFAAPRQTLRHVPTRAERMLSSRRPGSVVKGSWVVGVKSRAQRNAAIAALKAAGIKVTRGSYKGDAIEFSGPEATALRAADAVMGVAGVRYVEPEQILTVDHTPTDTDYPQQWGLPKIGAPAAWDSTEGSRSVVIAIVDTGVSHTHPDVAGHLDTADEYDFVNNDSVADDDQGHGTHVAGIAAGIENGTGIVGVAPECTILPVKVMDQSGAGSDLTVANGIVWAADHGADVINLSLGGYGYSQTLADAVNYANAKDCVVVAAAGNDGSYDQFSPAALPGVIGVASSDPADTASHFSNHGPAVDIAAPGSDILSAYWQGGSISWSGTSMATPFVAGAAALAKSVNPGLHQAAIAHLIATTATDDRWNPGPDWIVGAGFLNASSLVAAARSAEATPLAVTIVSPRGGYTSDSSNQYYASGVVTITADVSVPDSGLKRVDYIVDGAVVGSSTAAPYTFGWDASGALGGTAHTLTVTAYDNDLHTDSASVRVTRFPYPGDDAGPAAWSLPSPAPDSTVTSARPTMSVAATDLLGVNGWADGAMGPNVGFTLDGADYSSYVAVNWTDRTWQTAGTFSFTPTWNLSAGVHSVKIAIKNRWGVQSTYAWTFTYAPPPPPDSTPPTVAITSPAAGASVTGVVNAVATAADSESGVAAVGFAVDGTAVGTATAAPYSASFDADQLSVGPHSLTATAVDKAGNAASTSVQFTVPDDSPPDVLITSPADGSVVTGVVPLTASAADTRSGVRSVQFAVDGAPLPGVTAPPYTSLWDASAAVVGTHTITATATDNSGNSSVATISVVVPDTKPPVVRITSPADGSWAGMSTMIAADAADADSGIARVEIYVDGALIAAPSAAPYGATWDSSTATLGAHAIAAKAIDNQGNWATVVVQVNATAADKTPPVVTLTAPAEGSTASGATLVSASATDSETAVQRVEFSVDGVLISTDTSSPYSLTWDSSTVPAGQHTVQATAYDVAGNAASSSARVTVVAAGTVTGPAVWTGATPVANCTVTVPRPVLAVTASDPSVIFGSPYYSLKVDGVSQIPSVTWDATDHTRATFAFTPRADLAVGAHTVKYTIKNNAGAYSTFTWSFTYAPEVPVDTSPPTVSVSAPAPNADLTGDVTVTASAADAGSGIAGVAFRVDGTSIGTDTTAPYSATFNTSDFAPGPHTITALATDKAANQASASIPVTFHVPDTTPPVVALTSPAEGAVVSAAVPLAATASDDSGVAWVQFAVDGLPVSGQLFVTPYAATWDASAVSAGPHTITATASDLSGNTSLATVHVTVPDTKAPIVRIDGAG